MRLLGLTLAAGALSGLSSCEKENNDDLLLYTNVLFSPGGQPFQSTDVYTINGTAVQFSVLRFHMSGIGLQDVSGQWQYSDAYILAQPGQTRYEAGTFPPQQYTAFRFDVGVDSSKNFLDPTEYDSDNPLAPQSPSMHWSWTSGYIFLRIDGIYDGDGDGTPDPANGFEVHLGLGNFLSEIAGSGTFGADDAEEAEVTINFDPLKLFTGVDFPTVNTTHTMDNMPMAMQVRSNMASAFTVE